MKTDKKALIAYADQNGFKYPRLLIWLKFSFTGGIIGGLLFGIYLMFVIHTATESYSLLSTIKDILVCGLAGFFVGFLPASLTGLYITLRKIAIKNYIQYLELFFIGGIITILFGLIWLIYDNKNNTLKDFYFYLAAMILGGLSTVICGKLFLPKLPKNF